MKRLNKISIAVILIAAFLYSFVGAMPDSKALADSVGTIYYVDSAEGSDSNDGRSEATPWKTLNKINEAGGLGVFNPGDSILLKAGSVWNERLTVNFSGDSTGNITIGKYGLSSLRPVINAGGGQETAAITITNEEYITLLDLELTNFNAADPDDYLTGYYRRSGVWVQAYHNGVKRGIEIRNLDIHDVRGISLTGENFVDIYPDDPNKEQMCNKNHNAAIMINGWSWEVPDNNPAYYDGIVVENNNIHDVAVIGISVDGNAQTGDLDRYHKNVTIRNNAMIATGADAIMVGRTVNPMIEHNISYDAGSTGYNYKWIAGMWTWGCHGSTLSNNEVARVNYLDKGTSDSAAFDTDIWETGDHIYQYNYSHENEGGFMMNMGQLKDGTNIIRYNISQNDKHNGYTNTTMNLQDPAIIYNNTFYQDLGDGIIIKDSAKVTFLNNIFYVKGGTSVFPKQIKYYNNAFYGTAAPSNGINNIVGDPGLVNPGSGQDGMNTVDGYKLKAGSPLIGAGIFIEDNGGVDYFGNPLYKGAPDLGAFEHPDSTITDTTAPKAPTDISITGKTDTMISLSWRAVEEGIPLSAMVFNAEDDTVLATVMMDNGCVIEGLQPGTEYAIYIKSKDRAGNLSEKSDVLHVTTTIAAIVVDDAQATKTGTWATDTDVTANDGSSSSITKGTGTGTITWTPDLPQDGYYKVYYWLPNGTGVNASDTKYTIAYQGGSKTYEVNQKVAGGKWNYLGIHKFLAGTTGNVQVTDNANGRVVADAVKFLLVDSFDISSIENVTVVPEKTQLRLGEQTTATIFGLDATGNAMDLQAEDDVTITYSVGDDSIITINNGVITGKANGVTTISAQVTIGSKKYAATSVKIYVGPQFVVETPITINGQGDAVTKYVSFDIISASTEVVNNSEDRRKVAIIAALYNKEGMVDSSTKEMLVDPYSNTKVETEISMPQKIEGTSLKIFVWDGLSTMVPLTQVKLLEADTSETPDPVTPTPVPVTPTPVPVTPTPVPVTPTPTPVTPTPVPEKKLVTDSELEDAMKAGKDYSIEARTKTGRLEYRWTFTKENLKRAKGNTLTDVKLGLEVKKLNSNTEVNKLLTNKDKNADGLIIDFAHEGVLPVQARVKIYVGDMGIKKNTPIYLYNYNQATNKLEILPYGFRYKADKHGYITINIVRGTDYVVLPKKADASTYTTLINQLSVSPTKMLLYTGNTKYSKSSMKVTLPNTLEIVNNLKDKTSGTAIGGVTVTYKSSNNKVVTVSRDGTITAVGKGTANITTTVKLYWKKTKTYTTTVTVKDPSIKIVNSKSTMKLGSTYTFTASVEGFDKNSIVWKTTRRKIALINSKTAKVYARTKGTDYVEAIIGDKKVRVKVVVK
ncbi:MAG: fibronectin type III domain-containing protein [Anaerocolumna sp.]